MEEGRTSTKRPLYPIFEASEEAAAEEDNMEEVVHHVEKKRRLSVDQVRSLEKYFEQENKLEPERKLQLARELGLQPRQVAVWFQNRRARWKTKQLEKDYDALKSNLDSLKGDYECLMQEKDKLQAEVTRLTELLSSKTTKTEAPPRIKIDVELADTKEIESGLTLNSTSDSDDSEIVDGESPRIMQGSENGSFQLHHQHHHQHHHNTTTTNNNNNNGGGGGGGVALDMDQLECHIPGQAYEDVVYSRIPKLEETSFLDLEESDQGSISWWEWT